MAPSRKPVLVALVAVAACLLGTAGVGAGALRAAPGGRPAGPCLARQPAGTPIILAASLQPVLSGALVAVEVCVDHHGPYRFLVDTGSSVSVIAGPVASALGLHRAGPVLQAATALCPAKVTPVEVASWSFEGVPLHRQRLFSASLPALGGRRVDGILGSDVLSRFGAVRIDYRSGHLTLAGTEAPAPGRAAVAVVSGGNRPTPSRLVEKVRVRSPLTVITDVGSVVATVPVDLHGLRASLVVDSGAAISAVTPGVAAARHLRRLSRRVRVRGVGCSATVGTVESGPWSIDGHPLPKQGLALLPAGGAGLSGQGLLGSDVFRHYGAVVVDYRDARLLLEAG